MKNTLEKFLIIVFCFSFFIVFLFQSELIGNPVLFIKNLVCDLNTVEIVNPIYEIMNWVENFISTVNGEDFSLSDFISGLLLPIKLLIMQIKMIYSILKAFFDNLEFLFPSLGGAFIARY